MCTLIVARDVFGPRTVLLAANRDEDPARPSDPPRLLREAPRLVGGRDAVAGGTWLAIREGKAAVALLNRRESAASGPTSARRSRGLLTLDVAGVRWDGGELETVAGDPLAATALRHARASVAASSYAPFTLVWASARSCWLLAYDGHREPVATEIAPGWHVLTHAELDDPGEPRTAHLLRGLAGVSPTTPAEGEALLIERLRSHGEDGGPAVCLHQGRMRTVSASLILMSEGRTRYLHAEGRPCEAGFVDHTPLLEGAAQPGR